LKSASAARCSTAAWRFAPPPALGAEPALRPLPFKRPRRKASGSALRICAASSINVSTTQFVQRGPTERNHPAFDFTELKIQDIGDLGREVIDVGVLIAVVGSAEEQLGVVVQEYESHVVEGADLVRASIVDAEVQKLQERADPLRRTWVDGE